MDWQVIILTLGASLITGAVSLIGNIIVSKSSLKNTLLENQEQSKKEYAKRRIAIYNTILHRLAYIETNEDDEEALDEFELERLWLEDYHYCSKEVNALLHSFFKLEDKSNRTILLIKIKKIRNQIKRDINDYYGIKEAKKSRKDFF